MKIGLIEMWCLPTEMSVVDPGARLSRGPCAHLPVDLIANYLQSPAPKTALPPVFCLEKALSPSDPFEKL
jgi:hypothetical protein